MMTVEDMNVATIEKDDGHRDMDRSPIKNPSVPVSFLSFQA